MSGPVDVLAMLDAYRNVPCTWGRNHDKHEVTEARDAVAALIEAATQAKRAYWLARNSAAGLTNYCDESASSRRCERELSEAESVWHSAGLDTALANIGGTK